jgi:hypothetical protein
MSVVTNADNIKRIGLTALVPTSDTVAQFTAFSTKPTITRNASIGSIIGMPFRTMGFSGLYSSKSLTTQHVLAMRDRFQMCRIDTGRITAQMVKFVTERYGTVCQYIRHAIGMMFPFPIDGGGVVTIAKFIFASCPYPTGISFLDAQPKAFSHGYRTINHRHGEFRSKVDIWIAVSIYPSVMRPAHPFLFGWFLAIGN